MTEKQLLTQGWKFIKCSRKELNIEIVLCSGQSFRWKKNQGVWIGVVHKRVWVLQQDDTYLWYKVHMLENAAEKCLKNSRKRRRKMGNALEKAPKMLESKEIKAKFEPHSKNEMNNDDLYENLQNDEEILNDYFQLDVNLEKLCQEWSKVDHHFSSIASCIPGIRMLRQDPTENLFSFICSSNNNITRISKMVENMCKIFGEKICTISSTDYFSFPTVRKLAESNTEEILRGLGFGYRAKYIHRAAIEVHKNGGELWLNSLREKLYEITHKHLTTLPGIGAKVADCICMMSLDKPEAIPVDTHVWQIAVRDYKIPNMEKTKSLSVNTYKTIGTFFRNLWGPNAAWAMNFLFCADLKQNKHLKAKS